MFWSFRVLGVLGFRVLGFRDLREGKLQASVLLLCAFKCRIRSLAQTLELVCSLLLRLHGTHAFLALLFHRISGLGFRVWSF